MGPAVGLSVGVAMALLHFDYWALVGQQVATPLTALIALIVVTKWVPGLPHRGAQMGSLLRFGGNLVGVQLLGYVSRNVDSLLIGSRLGASTLGLYDRAFQILMLPINQVNAPATRVALPVLSRIRDDVGRFSAYVLRGQLIMTNVVTFILAFAIAQAPPLFLIVLGPQWTESAQIFQILAVGGVAQVASYAVYWVFLATDNTASNLRYSLLTRPLVIAAIFLGSVWGVQGIAIAYAASLVVLWPFGLWWLGRVSAAPVLEMFVQGVRSIVAYGVAGVISYALSLVVPEGMPLLRVAVGALGFLGGIGFALLVSRKFRRGIREIVELARHRKAL
jgi:O-antigen/teichoic acid export membrane protein